MSGKQEWRPIETFRPSGSDLPQYVIIFADGVVGEATFRPEQGDAGEWWWANTSPDDYYAEKIENWSISHWMPLPPLPEE